MTESRKETLDGFRRQIKSQMITLELVGGEGVMNPVFNKENQYARVGSAVSSSTYEIK